MNAEARVAAPPSGLVTLIATVPAVPAGVRAVIAVVVSCCTVPAVAPKRTTAPVWKPVPVITTSVPPAVGPVTGEEPVIVGGARYVKAEARVAVAAVGVGHADRHQAGAPGRRPRRDRRRRQLLHGARRRAEADHRAGLEARARDHHVGARRPSGPVTGDEPVIVGGARYVNAEACVAAPPSGLVTLIATGRPCRPASAP